MQNKIKDFRKKFGITQEDFADRVGVSRQTIVALEKGKYNPSVILACRIAKIFNTSVEDIFIMEVTNSCKKVINGFKEFITKKIVDSLSSS